MWKGRVSLLTRTSETSVWLTRRTERMIDHRLRPYATVYPFFSEKLCLHGSEMLVFAVIFGFWKRRREPVPISYRRFREVMGLSRSTVGKAMQEDSLTTVHHPWGSRPGIQSSFQTDFPNPNGMEAGKERDTLQSGNRQGTRPKQSPPPVRFPAPLIKI